METVIYSTNRDRMAFNFLASLINGNTLLQSAVKRSGIEFF